MCVPQSAATVCVGLTFKNPAHASLDAPVVACDLRLLRGASIT